MRLSPHLDRHVAVIVGSSPSAPVCCEWYMPHVIKIALNNAWRLRSDFNYSFYPDDFPESRRPPSSMPVEHIRNAAYRPLLKKAGGRIYTGATIAFASGYWAYMTLKPSVLGYVGCDMVYEFTGKDTHFYGMGSPDPLRKNISLRSLEAKSCRLFVKALLSNTLIVNLSEQHHTRLQFPRMRYEVLVSITKNSGWYASIFNSPLLKELLVEAQCIERKEQQAPFCTTRFRLDSIPSTVDNLSWIDARNEEWLQLKPLMERIVECT